MNSNTAMKTTISLMLALALSLLLISTAYADVYGNTSAPAYVELDAVQLDQLVAPIALDPDPLVAQILTSSTYPDQVSAADTWLNQNMNLPPDQRASGANNMSWDPAVKGLIEFPAVLDELAKNNAWTAQLGNAYYNQPGDVMNAIQAMRLQAQQSSVLVTTAQERVVVTAGVIDIVPVDPAVIYVPYYNPWRIWGALFVAYPGFVVLPPPAGIVWAGGIAFDPGIAVGVYEGYGWGFDAWAPAWDGGTVLYGGNTYISNSVTVVNHGYFGGHDRGVFEHDGRGVPHGYHACAHAGTARSRAASARAHGGFGKPNAGHPYAGRGMDGGHSSPFGKRAGNANHATTASRGNPGGSHGNANANRAAANHAGANHAGANHVGPNHGTTTAANRGAANGSHGANASRAGSANRAAGNYGAANRGGNFGSGNHGSANPRSSSPSAANHGMTNHGMANHGSASANRGGTATANRGGSPAANRGSAAANRGGAGMNRGGSMANRSAGSANHGSSMANRGSSMGNRGAGNSAANRGGAGASHGGGMASRGGSGGGHASGGRSGGRGR